MDAIKFGGVMSRHYRKSIAGGGGVGRRASRKLAVTDGGYADRLWLDLVVVG